MDPDLRCGTRPPILCLAGSPDFRLGHMVVPGVRAAGGASQPSGRYARSRPSTAVRRKCRCDVDKHGQWRGTLCCSVEHNCGAAHNHHGDEQVQFSAIGDGRRTTGTLCRTRSNRRSLSGNGKCRHGGKGRHAGGVHRVGLGIGPEAGHLASSGSRNNRRKQRQQGYIYTTA